jgi:lysophospholipase L1-like esterase
MQGLPAVSRPAWTLSLSGPEGRRSPVEIVANVGTYVTRINRTIREVAASRGLSVAEVSAHFGPPWNGKLASDCFHPSEDGYRDWTRAVMAVI